MGKASRRKRGKPNAISCLPLVSKEFEPNSMRISRPKPEPLPVRPEEGKSVFRFCQTSQQADQLASGKIWLGTLSGYRSAENQDRGDVGEGIDEYYSGHHPNVSGDEAMILARRMGVFTGRIHSASISGNRVSRKIPDAFVVCATLGFKREELNESFGKYCVEILSPANFFAYIDEELKKRLEVQGRWGVVSYSERVYVGFDDAPGPIGFVKPPDQYQDQQEVRFLWMPYAPMEIQPFLLDVPACAKVCKRII